MLRAIHRTFVGCTRRLFGDREGAAIVEFALIMPLLLFLYLGTIEASRLISYDRRLTNIAAALGDLVARSKGDITMAELNDYFTAAAVVISPMQVADLKQTVTCVYVDENGVTNVEWSYAYNGGTVHTVDTTYPLPSEFITIAKEQYVIVSIAEMEYEPLTTYVFDPGLQLKGEYYHLPRYGAYFEVI